jgi:hypothetical protein
MKTTYARPLFARLLNPTKEESLQMAAQKAEERRAEELRRAEEIAEMKLQEAKYEDEMEAKYPGWKTRGV